jgi:hypothetical protein
MAAREHPFKKNRHSKEEGALGEPSVYEEGSPNLADLKVSLY